MKDLGDTHDVANVIHWLEQEHGLTTVAHRRFNNKHVASCENGHDMMFDDAIFCTLEDCFRYNQQNKHAYLCEDDDGEQLVVLPYDFVLHLYFVK